MVDAVAEYHEPHELYLQWLMLEGANAIGREGNVIVMSSHADADDVVVNGRTIVCIVCAPMIMIR